MAKDNSPGLLSKVAKFVRNPTKDWSELDQQAPEQDSGYSKQALKEMIERKRQNDFVRKREFDQLRKLRRREPGAGVDKDPGRPSFFQSSLPSNPDERAQTLKKIDEIEAQMSKQWWKGKQDEASGRSTGFPVSQPAAAAPVGSPQAQVEARRTAQQATNFAQTQGSALLPDHAAEAAVAFAPTQMSSAIFPGGAPSAATAHGKQTPAANSGYSLSRLSSGFSNSQLFATELGDGGTDPDLEEAAIRFANSDDAGAEAGLMDALRGDKISPESAEVWTSALFDFYRATGQQASFDNAAMDFAQRFGRSPPAWFSMPELVGNKADTAAAPCKKGRTAKGAVWESPVELDLLALEELRRVNNPAEPIWHLNWTRLARIDASARESLAQMFADWCNTPVSVFFESPATLEKVLRSQTPSGDKTVNPQWWQVLMDALRLMGLQDEFELVALDYCVTFEVSPPSWKESRCTYKQERREAHISGDTQPMMAHHDEPTWPGARFDAPTMAMSMDDMPPALVELNGEILGDAALALEKLESARHGADKLVISCAKLIRVDFSAAGSILNWVSARQSEGCHVQFRDVHRLVAAFFSVIGINEHARIVQRSN